MNIIQKNINDLMGAVYNPRKELKVGDKEYEKLKKSIETFGYIDPIIWNKRTNTVVGGHQRLNVLKDLGYTSVDVVEVNLSLEEEKTLNIALNKIDGEWDADKLEDLLRELSNDTDIDIELTGFDLDEIDTMFNGTIAEDDDMLKDSNEERDKKLDLLCQEVEKPINNKRDIKLGDMFKLGKHKLLCGDSYNKVTYDKLVCNDTVELIFTDPPYNYDNLENKVAWSGAFKSKNGITAVDKLHSEGMSKLSLDKLEYLFNKNIPSIYCCCCINDLKDYMDIGYKYGYVVTVHVWCKTTAIPMHGGKNSGTYLKDLEYIVYFRCKNATFNNELGLNYYNQFNKDTTIDIDIEAERRKWYSSYIHLSSNEVVKDKSDANSEHPTVKPLKLIIPKIAISSSEGGIVVDMFGGSGSTLIACEKLNRTCYMVEYATKYMNEIIDRWEAYTGEKAEFIKNIFE